MRSGFGSPQILLYSCVLLVSCGSRNDGTFFMKGQKFGNFEGLYYLLGLRLKLSVSLRWREKKSIKYADLKSTAGEIRGT